MPLDHLEACTFGPHLGNWSVLILDPCLSPQNFAVMELLINQKKMGSSFPEVLKYYNPCYTIKQGLKCEQLVRLQVQSIVEWTSVNHKQLNFKKTWAMLLKGKSTKALPVPVASIEWKPSLKLLGVTFQSDPCNWDLHLDNTLSKASSRLYILRVCKFYGLPLDHLHLLFTSLILPIFTYAVEVWGCAYYHKYRKSSIKPPRGLIFFKYF